MGSAALGMGAWSGYDNLGRSRTRSMSLLVPPRLGGMYYPTIQQTVVVDGALNGLAGFTGIGAGVGGAAGNEDTQKTRRRETIFGPDVGDDDQPGWTSPDEGNKVSVDVVKRWVERAKGEEGLHATTTLQALVNLKRPTLLLQPLDDHHHHHEADVSAASAVASSPRSSVIHPAPLHLLKFSYDAMTPQVQITLSLHPSPSASGEHIGEPQVLYTGTHPGGFNQAFALPTDAALDLSAAIAPLPTLETTNEGKESEDSKTGDDDEAHRASQSEDTTRSSIDRTHAAATTPDLAAIPELPNPDFAEPSRRRFGLFGRRQRENDVEAQIEMTQQQQQQQAPATPPVESEEEKPAEPEHGMRLLIRIEALGDDGPLRRRNAQLTHMLVSGTWVADSHASTTGSISGAAGKRVWVVKVVRREAQIGAHSFLLKEIYGLSSSSTGADTTYPPTSDPYASAPNECIVCLTSPRDVVLLPCRHLVVCRECAVGMVEFGAGGRVARRDDETAADAGTGAAVTGGGIVPMAAPPAPAAPTLTQPSRRKKKAKGWYCPVCRQPYTSLLRLVLPPSKEATSTVSRPASIRSVRTTRSTRSIAPTLPDGAEAMLARLPPQGHAHGDEDEDDGEEDNVVEVEHIHGDGHIHGDDDAVDTFVPAHVVPADQRPQFVVAEHTINPPPRAVVAGSVPAQYAEAAPALESESASQPQSNPVPEVANVAINETLATQGEQKRLPEGTV